MFVLDLDGVIFDFCEAAFAAHNRPYSLGIPTSFNFYKHDWGLTSEEFWSVIDKRGSDFWADLKPYPWAEDIVALVANQAAAEGVPWVVATSPCLASVCTAGKVDAIKKFFGSNFREYNITPCKWHLSGPGRFLIDDHRDNCEKWEDVKHGGGTAFIFPQPWNTVEWNVDRVQALRNWL